MLFTALLFRRMKRTKRIHRSIKPSSQRSVEPLKEKKASETSHSEIDTAASFIMYSSKSHAIDSCEHNLTVYSTREL